MQAAKTGFLTVVGSGNLVSGSDLVININLLPSPQAVEEAYQVFPLRQ
jgi:hypothetical protein